nr:silent information regulator protein Sir2 [Candidatus Sigynarchaeota archaeon]
MQGLNISYMKIPVKIKAIKQHPGYQCLLIIGVMLGAPLLYGVVLDVTNNGKEITPVVSSRVLESLNRGLVAMRIPGGVYLSWRMLASDPSSIGFDVYRQNNSDAPVKLNGLPINITSDFADTSVGTNTTGLRYWVNSTTGTRSEKVRVTGESAINHVTISIVGNYTPVYVGFGDLDGDGSLDYVVKLTNTEHAKYKETDGPSPSTYKIAAYSSNGTFLWQNDLGWDILLNPFSSPFMVYDLDGDGRAEIITKTGTGDHRDANGNVDMGPETLSVWDGFTGVEVCRTDWIPRWKEGGSYTPHSRLGIAYLDGMSPYIVMARGIYGPLKVKTFRYVNQQLEAMWYWDSWHEFGFGYLGGGSHWLQCVDVDHDSKDEIILGSCVLDDNGKGLWTTNFQHADHVYVGEIDPLRPGLEVYFGIQGEPTSKLEVDFGMCCVDARTGKVIWAGNETTRHIHDKGLVSDVDGRYPGMECYSGEADFPDRWLFQANGTLLANETTFNEGTRANAAFWDADLQREIINWANVYNFEDRSTLLNYWRPDQRIIAIGDLFGDWREEFVVASSRELRIYTTTIPAIDRRTTLLADPIYRNSVAHSSMGYWQVPMMQTCLADPSVPYNPSQPVVYNAGLHQKIETAAFWMAVDCFLASYVWEFSIYGGIVVLIAIAYLIAFIRRQALQTRYTGIE